MGQAVQVAGAGNVPLPAQSPPRSYKVACITAGDGDKPSYNGMRYSSADAAQRAGSDLYSRWTALKSFSVEPSDYEPNDSK